MPDLLHWFVERPDIVHARVLALDISAVLSVKQWNKRYLTTERGRRNRWWKLHSDHKLESWVIWFRG
jgi:hypothetical protein